MELLLLLLLVQLLQQALLLLRAGAGAVRCVRRPRRSKRAGAGWPARRRWRGSK